MGSQTSHASIEGAFDRRGDMQNEGLRCLSENVYKEIKASNICKIARMSEIKRETHACCRVLSV